LSATTRRSGGWSAAWSSAPAERSRRPHLRRATGRTGGGAEERALRPYGDAAVTVDFVHAEATVHGRPLALTPREFRLLTALVTHARRTLSPEQLLGLAWDDPAGDPRRVKVYVG
jgi:two-component system, OmpR family, KDP operon response regulator KdpE